jgi:hypothetical protein
LDLARLHPDAVTSGTILTASLWGWQGCIYFKRFSKGTKKHHPFRMFQLKRNILYIYNMLVDHDNLVPMRGCPKQQPHSNSQQHAATTNNNYSNLHHLLNRHHVCLTWLPQIWSVTACQFWVIFGNQTTSMSQLDESSNQCINLQLKLTWINNLNIKFSNGLLDYSNKNGIQLPAHE